MSDKARVTRANMAVILMVLGVLVLVAGVALAFGVPWGLMVLGVAMVAVAVLLGWT